MRQASERSSRAKGGFHARMPVSRAQGLNFGKRRAYFVRMDDYPEHLTPPKDDRGNVDQEKFSEWWAWAKPFFLGVPDLVARYWLYEHWGWSPYRWVSSREHRFEEILWSANDLHKIRSEEDDLREDQTKSFSWGRRLIENKEYVYRTARYMLEHRTFPVPIVVMDNTDGHLNSANARAVNFPHAYILMEGHRRFSMALYLVSTNRLNPIVPVWLMTKIPTG
ncbi:hypothetical protein A1D31_34285 [Bradyrhizobium liaoningense]|nr:hypothetical protein A1D31_34285 [Bradyrhizobium liaoningense]